MTPCLSCLSLLAALSLAGPSHAWQDLDDRALSAVSGRDGLNFNLQGFSLSGDLSLVYRAPGGQTLTLSSWAISRSDDPDHLYDDPYSLSVQQRPGGGADVIALDFPANAAGRVRWQAVADLAVQADGLTVQGGALQLQDLALMGGGLRVSTPDTPGVEGIALGLSLRAELGALVLRPRGRDVAAEELRLSGLRVAAAAADGTLQASPWVLADVARQPLLMRAMQDAKGPALQFLLDWHRDGEAPLGGLAIDSLRFVSDTGASLDLGSSRIGTMQLQYLDLRLRPGP